jgi:hypothetical protein
VSETEKLSAQDRRTAGLKRGGSPGRPKGVPNKTTTLLKDAIIQAAEQAGGEGGIVAYLQQQAVKNPGPFLALVGKVLPMQVTGEDGGPVQTSVTIKFG